MRERAGLTQVQISKVLDIPQSTIASWETGRALPRADKLPQIAKLLKCTVDELLLEDREEVK
jgi:transcriptional regulator with XRE-family HTH domain|nr:MAG TPA: helix-turn-helix domain protein [Caudoviricetes sp.]